MSSKNTLSEKQLDIVQQPRIAVVSTISRLGYPHQTSVWFVYLDGAFYLSVPSTSQKYINLQRDPKMSLLIDVRNTYVQYGFCVQGTADLIDGDDAASIRQSVHTRYIKEDALADPNIGGFFENLDDVAVCLRPERIFDWDMEALDQQVFNGAILAGRSFHDIAY